MKQRMTQKRKTKKNYHEHRKTREHWKSSQIKWQDMKWDGLMQRITRGRCPCHWQSIKDLKKRGKTRRERVFFWRWTQYCFSKIPTKNMKGFFSSRIEMYQQEIQNSKKRLQQQRAQTNSSFPHKNVLSNVFPQKVVKITMVRKNVQKKENSFRK